MTGSAETAPAGGRIWWFIFTEPLDPMSIPASTKRPRQTLSEWVARLTGSGWGAKVPMTIWIGLLCAAVVIVADGLLQHESGISGDEPFYVRMAAHPSGPHNFPYAYRIAVPWLVHVLPFSQRLSFEMLAICAIAASGAALFALLQDFDVSVRLAVALTIGFVLSPTLLVVILRNGRSIDPASILVMVLGSLFIVRRQKVALAATLLVGVAVRESSLFLIPFAYAVWAESLVDRRALRDVALVSAVPLVAYVLLRTSIDAVGKQYIPGYTGPFFKARIDVIRQALSLDTLSVELRRLAYTYGPLWLIAPVAVATLPFARRGLVLVALCVISFTFALDWGRVIFLAAPVFYVAAASVLQHRRRLALATVIALFALDIGYAAYMQSYGIRHGLDSTVHGRIPVY